MEVDQIQCKFRRFGDGNGRLGSPNLGQNPNTDEQYPDEEEDGEREAVTAKNGGRVEASVDLGGGVGRFYGWPSSRIVRVTRASGGKDRHSKVLTSKGLRDRRVRLSVHTAIQFYDLQDRLGYDQPSKAVEWLLRAAAGSIAELPPMSTPFPDTVSDEKRSSTGGSDQVGFDIGDTETSKGSGLLLSRSESRIRARERAKERAAEKKEKDQTEPPFHVPSLNIISQTASFTELLNGGFSRSVSAGNGEGNGNVNESISPIGYFTNGFSGHSTTHLGQMQFVNSLKQNELQFDFAPDNLVPVGSHGRPHDGGSSAYSLNFAISSANSSGFAGFNRGTLQSNSSPPSLLSPVLRFPPADGSPGNFLIGAPAPGENHHHFLSGLDARLQLYYSNDGSQKGRGKN